MTKRINYIFLILLILSTNLFGQDRLSKTDRIGLYAYKIDTAQTKIDSFSLSFDSIGVSVKTKTNKIATINLFERSKSLLIIEYYFKDKRLLLVNVSEQSPKFDDLHSYSIFYYDNGKIFDEKYRHTIRSCLAIPMDKSIYDLYGYNPDLNSKFLKKYIVELLDKIKLQATNVSYVPFKGRGVICKSSNYFFICCVWQFWTVEKMMCYLEICLIRLFTTHHFIHSSCPQGFRRYRLYLFLNQHTKHPISSQSYCYSSPLCFIEGYYA